jgi:hypothetical protein
MPITDLHNELASISGTQPAGYIMIDAFSKITLDRLIDSIALLKGKNIPAGDLSLSASLTDVKWQNPNPATKFLKPPSPSSAYPDREIDIVIDSAFLLTVGIFVTGDPSKLISEVFLDVEDAKIHLSAEDNKLVPVYPLDPRLTAAA